MEEREVDLTLISLPDGVSVPSRFWLLKLGGDWHQVMIFFHELEAQQVASKLGEGADTAWVMVLGPYVLRA